MDRAKEETKNLMRKILQEHQLKEKILFSIAKTFVDKIKLAYGKFIRAHNQLRVYRRRAPHIIGRAIIQRYKANANAIKFKNFLAIRYVSEVSNMLALTKSFYMCSY